ncbi:MAG: PEP-CTERM sorting domain-containing protein [Bryobacterales bacterium]|jgi:hypothetical protein|nr:PEP-CTERM sorting domain-containing protein [Bryobacterales bacterium]
MKTRNIAFAKLLLAAVATMLSLGQSAVAGTIVARVDGLGAYGQVQMSLDNGSWVNQYAGIIQLTQTGGTSDWDLVGTGGAFLAFCVEPRENIALNQTYTWNDGPMTAAPTSLGGMSTAQANQLLVLMSMSFPDFTVSLTNIQAAAIQIAIWEIVEEKSGVLNVLDGSIKFRRPSIAGTLELAQSLLNQVNTQPVNVTGIRVMTSVTDQDLMIQIVDTPADVATPEPATLSMLGLGLFALGLAKRKAARRSC